MSLLAPTTEPLRDLSPQRTPLLPGPAAEPPPEGRITGLEYEAQIIVLIARAERACGPLFDHLGPIAGE